MGVILLVDDSAFSRRILHNLLRPLGHEIFEAEDGIFAVELFAVHQPDLVFLDMTMRDMDGLTVLSNLRQIKPDSQIIIATADIQESTRQKVEDAGATAFVPKPFNQEKIVPLVNSLMGVDSQDGTG